MNGSRIWGYIGRSSGGVKWTAHPISSTRGTALFFVSFTLDADEMRNEQRLRLRRSIDSLRGQRDVVIIDTLRASII